jgi:glycosyltransferase involved in cell wall biosynthesis
VHVAHVITKLDVGGAQTHVVELALGQVAAGHRVDVVTGVGGPAADRLTAVGVPVLIVPELGDSHGRLSQRAAVAAVTTAVGRITPELVHGHSSNGGLAARLAARRLQLPSVYTAHGWPFQQGAAWKQRLMSYAGEFVGGHVGDAVIVLTEAEYRSARRARVVPADRLWVVPNGIADAPANLRRTRPLGDRAPVLVMVARFAPPKLQTELVGALAELRDVPWTLRLVGDGPQLDECRGAVERLGLVERVEFLGHRDDVAAVLAASDVGVLWSRYEGLPISVMEYMRAGLCCVGSDLPGVRELFGVESAGRVAVSQRDLRNVLRGLVSAPTQIDELGLRARSRYETCYSAAGMVDATDAVYRAITGNRLTTR